ncbi:rab-GTPase-TBC domain-containing protein [Lipomyces tetrasporus]|uniref:GTPase-activating protein GYP5 n=1 Tax=Lipomyces tetrasporus TaxID=54092 RepID=A0AAD7VVU9_9ASCO|nr:rab-GTPase-TBC domain-containing protein [Lipomyces tetrasporus]KAJ8102595.1 rab-GTPase-TBC domain-containing protein [Lipomyces tetrasporus]
MSSVTGDFAPEVPTTGANAPPGEIVESPMTTGNASNEPTETDDIVHLSSQFDVSDEIEPANGLLKVFQADASADNTETGEFEDAVDLRSPRSERDLTSPVEFSVEGTESTSPIANPHAMNGDAVGVEHIQEEAEGTTEGESEVKTETSHGIDSTGEEAHLAEAKSVTSSSELAEVEPVPIEKLDEINLNDETTMTATGTADVSNVTDSSTTYPTETVQSSIVVPPPLPPRNPNKKSPFSWLRSNSKDKEKESVTEGTPPPIPPRKSKKQPVDDVHPISRRPSQASHANSSTTTASETAVPNYELLLSRVDANREDLQSKEQSEKEAHMAGTQKLQEEFEKLRRSKSYSGAESDDDLAAIEWEFWTSIVADYPNMARSHPSELTRAVQNGLPPPLRGTIWQLMASSKSQLLEDVYSSLLTESSPHEKGIRRDISRTSFAKTANHDALFNVIKAYSLWDPEVGYIQGMAFIAVPLILNMNEEEAFCLLVDLMKIYTLRDLFLPDMPGLHIRLYQFDRIIEDTLPAVHVHLARQGVLSSMYASQWFLTFFAYKFPLPIVLRIFDIVVAEGLEAILRFGVALLRRNADAVVNLEFDALVYFLKNGLFDVYVDSESSTKHTNKAPSIFKGSSSSQSQETTYRVNELVADAYAVKILPATLKKYEAEYIELHRAEVERMEEIENLRTLNGQLTLQIKRLENSLATLNREHIEVANEMVQGKVEIEKLKDENTDLKAENEDLKTKHAELQERIETLPAEVEAQIEAKVKEEMDSLMARNLEVMNLNQTLEDQMASLEKELVDTKVQYASVCDNGFQCA